MNARTSLAATVAAFAVTATAAGAATPAPALPPPVPTLLPSRVGGSVSFHYDANESSPRGGAGMHAVITLTRVVNDRVAITVTPDDGVPSAFVGRVQNGELAIESGGSFRGAGGPGGADSSGVPPDGPIGGLPAPGGGAGRGGFGQGAPQGGYGQPGTGGYGRGAANAVPADRVRDALPSSVRVLAALIASRPSAGPGARQWSFTASAGGRDGGVPMSARIESVRGAETTIVADGSGDVQAADFAGAGTYGGYGGRRRGSGANGGGYPGGGANGGYPGGGSPGGAASGGYAAPRPAATVAYHIESTFRGGRLELARGTETITARGAAPESAAGVRWTLTPL